MPLLAFTQNATKTIVEGNQLYQQKNWLGAQLAYEKALQKEANNTTALFNYANALHKQQQYSKAVAVLDDVIDNSKNDPFLQAKAYYNKGVIAAQQQQTEQAVQAFKQSLKLNNADEQTRENLQKALQTLQKQQQKQQPPPPKNESNKKPNEKPLTKQEAEKQLNMLREEEKRLQKEMQNKKYSPTINKKDW